MKYRLFLATTLTLLFCLTSAAFQSAIVPKDTKGGTKKGQGESLLIVKDVRDVAKLPPPPPQISRIVISTNVAGAEVIINSKLRFKTESDGFVRKPVDLSKADKAVITVRHPDFNEITQNITLKRGDITPVKLDLVSKYGDILLGGIPENAKIFLDNQELASYERDKDQQVSIKRILVGNRKLKIDHPDYIEWTGELEVKPGIPTPFNVPVERALAQLTLNTLSGAKVYLNGEERGEVPPEEKLLVSDVIPGTYEVTVVKNGYIDYKSTETFAVGAKEISVKLVPIPNSSDFDEYFRSGLSGWVAPKEWRVEKNGIVVNGSSTFGYPKDRNYRDFDALFSFRLSNGKGIAWAVRIQGREKEKYYLFYLTGPKNKNPLELRTYISEDGKVDINKPFSTVPANVLPITEKDRYTLEIEARGNKIFHFITPQDGKDRGRRIPIGAFIDERNLYTYGNLGFRTLDGEENFIEDLHIRPIESSEKK